MLNVGVGNLCHVTVPSHEWSMSHTHQNWVTHSKSAFHMACVWTLKTLGTSYVLKKCIISTKIIIYCLDCVVQPNALLNSAKFSLQTWTSIDFLRRHFHDNLCWDNVLHLGISLIPIKQFSFLVNISQDMLEKLWFYHIRKLQKKIWSMQIVPIQKKIMFCYWYKAFSLLPGHFYSYFCSECQK